MKHSFDFTGRVAWVSGAASGIGEATARMLAESGAAVAVTDCQSVAAGAVAEDIRVHGGQAIAVTTDVTEADQIRRSIDATVDAFGRLDILVNNAGIVLVRPIEEMNEEEWSRVMDINVRSIYLSLQSALPYLREHRRGRIVNIGSVSSFVGQAHTPAYTTSKHAVLGLTRSIALDYAADGIRCNCVCPGITDTPMLREHLGTKGEAESQLANRLRRVASGEIIFPRQVASAVLYLLSDLSDGVTGTTLTIDGGYLAAAEWETKGDVSADIQETSTR